MEVGRAPADRVETVSIHESLEMIPAGKQVSESLQECFPSGSPAATWYLFSGMNVLFISSICIIIWASPAF